VSVLPDVWAGATGAWASDHKQSPVIKYSWYYTTTKHV
jgi:hypothetical protein